MSQAQTHLRESATQTSRTALDVLIRKHMNLVYASALRQVRDAHLAEDVTQAVFLILARKADTIREGVAVGGWLLAVTRRTAVHAMKRQSQDKRHERIIAKPERTTDPEAEWEKISPVLDEVLSRLSPQDRDAIVLRVLENESLAAVGAELGVSEDTAGKRVGRALDRLRNLLKAHGINAGTTSLTITVSAHAVHTAPAHLLASTLSGGASASAAAVAIAKGTMSAVTWATFKAWGAAAAACMILLALATTLYAINASRPTPPRPPASIGAPAGVAGISAPTPPTIPIPKMNWKISADFSKPSGGEVAEAMAIDPAGNIYSVGAALVDKGITITKGMIYEKPAGESSWKTVYELPYAGFVAFAFDAAGNLFATASRWQGPTSPEETVFLKRPAGQTAFIKIEIPDPPVPTIEKLAVDSEGNVYAASTNYAPFKAWKLPAGGVALHPLPLFTPGKVINVFIIPSGPFAGLYSVIHSQPFQDTIFKSTDGGVNWNSVGPIPPMAGLKGMLYRSPSAVVWDHSTALYFSQTVCPNVPVNPISPNRGHFFVQKSMDGGATWTVDDDFPIVSGKDDQLKISFTGCDGDGNVYVSGQTLDENRQHIGFLRANRGGQWFTLLQKLHADYSGCAVDSHGTLFVNETILDDSNPGNHHWRVLSLALSELPQTAPPRGNLP